MNTPHPPAEPKIALFQSPHRDTKVDKDSVKALKAAQFSFIDRAPNRQSRCIQPPPEQGREDDSSPLSSPTKSPRVLVSVAELEALSDIKQHQDAFDALADRHPAARARMANYSVGERFFLNDEDETEDPPHVPGVAGVSESDSDDSDEHFVNGSKRPSKDRQVDYRRGELLLNPVVTAVMRQCAEEGVALQPKHHAADWKMPKQAAARKQQASPSQSQSEVPPLEQAGGGKTEDEPGRHSEGDEEPGGHGMHGPGAGAGGSVTGTLSASSSDAPNKLQPAAPRQPRLHTGHGKSRPKPKRRPTSANSSPRTRGGSAQFRPGREKLLQDMKLLQDKRMKVALVNKKLGLSDATLSKSGVRLKKNYQRRFQRLDTLIRKCEECAAKTRSLRERGLLRDQVAEELAISEELNSQREMMLTKQQFEDDPLWKRPPHVPPAQSSSRPQSAGPTSVHFSRRPVAVKKSDGVADSGEDGSASLEEEQGDEHTPLPGLMSKRSEVVMKWHREDPAGTAQQRHRSIIKTVTMDELAANAKKEAELSDQLARTSKIETVTMDALKERDEDDDFSDEEEDEDEDDEDRTPPAGQDKESQPRLKAQRPASAPSSSSSRSLRHRKVQHSQESSDTFYKQGHDSTTARKVKFSRKPTTSRSRSDVSKSKSKDSGQSDSDSSDSDDDYFDEEEEEEFKSSSGDSARPTRHKRAALMGARANVATDNDKTERHKSQLAMELDDFMDVYGKDVFTNAYKRPGLQRGESLPIEAKREVFTVISTFLMANNNAEKRSTVQGGKNVVGGAGPVTANSVAKDTLGIMDLFLRDMKQRHQKVQNQNTNLGASEGTDATESDTKAAMIKSYNEYWQRQRGKLAATQSEEAVVEEVKEDVPLTAQEQVQQQERDLEKELRQQFNDERAHLLESRRQASKEMKERRKQETQAWLVKRMEGILGRRSEEASQEEQQRAQVQQLSVEVSLLFSGFEKVDQAHDGFLSPGDLVRFCKQYNVSLRGRDISAMMWLMDDNRRGKLTFDDIMKFYIRNREEFGKSGRDFQQQVEEAKGGTEKVKDDLSKPSKKVIQTGFGAFGVENENAKGRVFDGCEEEELEGSSARRRKAKTITRPSRPTGPAKGVQEMVVTSGDLRSQPLLLFRVLFFVAMQDASGELHMMSAFQTLSQLFGRAADERFSCIFLRSCVDLDDRDRETLSGFVEHMKREKVAVKKVRLQLRAFK
mmetsp:Transcript_34949/g.65218  ORF Transcript_34949/g.65218 Transcript_34949/m.65218 type:complete len:1216 (-) Transcript_34949:699-4346(-)